MEGIREKKKRKTKQSILDAAISLFGKKGYEQTSMATLAQKAGIGKSTIYTYFATKREILIAFCEEELEYVYKEIDEQAITSFCNDSGRSDFVYQLFFWNYLQIEFL